jgi:hypothetical protein
MSGMAADYQVSVAIMVDDVDKAHELERLLLSEGAQDVQVSKSDSKVEGLAFIPIIVGAVIGVSALVDVYVRWRKNHMCQEIIDARDKGKPEITVNCDIKDGRIIVLLPEGKIEIHEVPDGVNIADLLQTALSAGAEAVKTAAEKIGAKVDGPKPI